MTAALSRFPRSTPADRGSERFPIGPLVELAGGVTALAETIGVPRRYVQRWAHTGLTVAQADTGAVALGLHPALVWPDWFPTPDPSPPAPAGRPRLREVHAA